MEVPNGHKHRDLICIYEAFGTAFLLISVNWGALGGSQAVAVAYGIFGYITVMSPICGSNFNPAVTLGILVKDTGSRFSDNLITALCTITAQIAGGFLGVLFVLIAVNLDVPIEQNIAILKPGPGATFSRVFITEAFGTFLFVSLILSVKYHQKKLTNTLGCFVVGMALYGVLNMVGGVSGGCINPAVGLVQCIFQFCVQSSYKDAQNVEFSQYWFCYVFGTATGGILAGCFQRLNDYSIKAMESSPQFDTKIGNDEKTETHQVELSETHFEASALQLNASKKTANKQVAEGQIVQQQNLKKSALKSNQSKKKDRGYDSVENLDSERDVNRE